MRMAVLVVAVLAAGAPAADAIDRLTLEVAELTVPGATVTGASATLDLTDGSAPKADIRARELELGPELGEYRNLDLHCSRLYVHEPHFACRSGQLSALGGPLGRVSARIAAEYNQVREELSFQGSGVPIAGGEAHFEGRLGPKGWNIESAASRLDIQKVRVLIAPWVPIPEDLSFDGTLEATGSAAGSGATLNATAQVTTPGFNFSNEAATIVAEKVAGVLEATAVRTRDGIEIESRLDGTAGQALVHALLFDLGANPLELQARTRVNRSEVEITELFVAQKNLVAARGTGRAVLGKSPKLTQARIDVDALQFPAAYTSFLQIALAATDFGTLQTTGSASGSVEIADNAIVRADGKLAGLTLEDTNGKFSMQGVTGEPHAAAASS
jgi:hypothetical protein